MELTPRKSTLKNTPRKDETLIPIVNSETPKKVRFSVSSANTLQTVPAIQNVDDKRFSAEDVLSMLNNSSLSDIENSSSDEEWIVTKVKNVSLVSKSTPSRNGIIKSSFRNEIVSPLKLLRRPEYEVNKTTKKAKKSEPVVSPIVIKRKKEAKMSRSSAVSMLPLSPSSKCNREKFELNPGQLCSPKNPFRHNRITIDDSDTENEVVSPKMSSPIKKKKSCSQSVSNLSSRRVRRDKSDLEEDSVEERIYNLRLTDTPVKATTSGSESDKPLSERLLTTEGKGYLQRLGGYPLLEQSLKSKGRKNLLVVVKKISEDVSSKYSKLSPNRAATKSSGSESEKPLSERLLDTESRGFIQSSGSESEKPLSERLLDTESRGFIQIFNIYNAGGDEKNDDDDILGGEPLLSTEDRGHVQINFATVDQPTSKKLEDTSGRRKSL